VTLSVAGPRADGNGLHSSGMFILNPPYTLEATLRETMPYLVQVLGQDAGATFRIEKGTQVTGAIARDGVAGAPRQPVGNARRASPLSGGGSLRLPGQAFGDGPRARGDGEQGRPPSAAAGRGPRAPAAGQRDGDAAQGERKATPRSAGSGTRTQSRKAGPNAATAPRAPSKRTGSGRS